VATNLSPKLCGDAPVVRGRVVAFRRPARGRGRVARRPSTAIPASQSATRHSKYFLTLEWQVAGLVAILLLCLVFA